MRTSKLAQIATLLPGYPFRGKIPASELDAVHVVHFKNLSADECIDWAGFQATRLIDRKDPDWLQLGNILFLTKESRNHAVLIDDGLTQEKNR